LQWRDLATMGTMPGRLVNAHEAKDAVVVWRCRSMAGNSMGDTNKILPFKFGASICECAVCFFTYTQALIWLVWWKMSAPLSPRLKGQEGMQKTK